MYRDGICEFYISPLSEAMLRRLFLLICSIENGSLASFVLHKIREHYFVYLDYKKNANELLHNMVEVCKDSFELNIIILI